MAVLSKTAPFLAIIIVVALCQGCYTAPTIPEGTVKGTHLFLYNTAKKKPAIRLKWEYASGAQATMRYNVDWFNLKLFRQELPLVIARANSQNPPQALRGHLMLEAAGISRLTIQVGDKKAIVFLRPCEEPDLGNGTLLLPEEVTPFDLTIEHSIYAPWIENTAAIILGFLYLLGMGAAWQMGGM